MADKRVYVEQRPQGDYAVRRREFATSERRAAHATASHRPRPGLDPGSRPHVERVRHTSGGSPDKWRKA